MNEHLVDIINHSVATITPTDCYSEYVYKTIPRVAGELL